MTDQRTHSISLPPELEEFVSSRIDSGRYHSVSAVVCDGLRLLEEHEHARQSALDELREQIAVGLEQAKRGEFREGGEVMARLFERHEERVRRAEAAGQD